MAMRRRAYSFRQAVPCLVLVVAAAAAQAQPQVRIRAGTRIDLSYTEAAEELRLSGALLDDLNRPMSGEQLELVVSAEEGDEKRRLTLRTDDRGRFQTHLPLAAGRYRAIVTYEGDRFHAGSQRSQTLDLDRHAVALAFLEPSHRRLDLDRSHHQVMVQASSAIGGGRLDVTLQDELDRVLASGRTDDDGRFSVALPTDVLGPPALGKLMAHSAADATRASGHAEIAIVRFRPTQLSLVVAADGYNGRLELAGELTSSQGALAHKAVGLFEGGRHLATVPTDRHGRFRHRTSTSVAPDERPALDFTARYQADAPWVGSSESAVVRVALRSPPAPHALWLVLPVLLSLAAVWLATRRRAWAGKTASARPEHRVPGLHASQPARLALTPQRHVQGKVVDADTDLAVDRASVRLQRIGPAPAPAEITPAVSAGGWFEAPPLEDGTWRIDIEAPGYAPLHGELQIPHRGEWTDVTARLASLRGAAYEAYRPAAAAVLGGLEGAVQATPRETLAHAERQNLPVQALRRLTGRLERAAYDRPIPLESDLHAIASEADQALRELAREETNTPRDESSEDG